MKNIDILYELNLSKSKFRLIEEIHEYPNSNICRIAITLTIVGINRSFKFERYFSSGLTEFEIISIIESIKIEINDKIQEIEI